MQYALDIIIVVTLILFVCAGAKNGLIRALGDFLGSVAAAFVASWTGSIVAEKIYVQFFRQNVLNKITAAVSAGNQDASGYFSGLPKFLVRWLSGNGVTEQTLNSAITSGAANAAQTVEAAISPMLIGIIKVFAVIIIFMLVMVIIKVAVRLLTGIFELPILKQINSVFGGLFGFFAGAVIIWVVLGALGFFAPMLPADIMDKINTAVNSSMIYSYVTASNPFDWIFR
ncbi:MAG: CvpA family protein [Clostridia bacterium]|nr:CvpA family protein [Clostridia bacterium]